MTKDLDFHFCRNDKNNNIIMLNMSVFDDGMKRRVVFAIIKIVDCTMLFLLFAITEFRAVP
jgi:hypothetical protein